MNDNCNKILDNIKHFFDNKSEEQIKAFYDDIIKENEYPSPLVTNEFFTPIMQYIQVKITACYDLKNIEIIAFGIGNNIENAVLDAIKEDNRLLDNYANMSIEYRTVYLNGVNEVINIIPFENDPDKKEIKDIDYILSMMENTKIYYHRMNL
jgi:hypothetical protein